MAGCENRAHHTPRTRPLPLARRSIPPTLDAARRRNASSTLSTPRAIVSRDATRRARASSSRARASREPIVRARQPTGEISPHPTSHIPLHTTRTRSECPTLYEKEPRAPTRPKTRSHIHVSIPGSKTHNARTRVQLDKTLGRAGGPDLLGLPPLGVARRLCRRAVVARSRRVRVASVGGDVEIRWRELCASGECHQTSGACARETTTTTGDARALMVVVMGWDGGF